MCYDSYKRNTEPVVYPTVKQIRIFDNKVCKICIGAISDRAVTDFFLAALSQMFVIKISNSELCVICLFIRKTHSPTSFTYRQAVLDVTDISQICQI